MSAPHRGPPRVATERFFPDESVCTSNPWVKGCHPYLRPAYLPLPAGAVGHTNVHDAGTTSAGGGIFSGVRLFFVSRLLNPTRSSPSIVFHAFAVALNSLQPDSHVSTSALVGGISMPFCESGARTVLNTPLIE